MPDLDPIKAQATLDISSMQTGFEQLAQAVQQATDKIKSSLEDASTKSKKHLQDVEHETENLGDAFKKLGTNFYENIHTPLGEIHERMLPFLEELSGGVLAIAAVGAAAVVTGAELINLSNEFADTTRQLQTQSQMFGISTEQMQVLGDEAKRLGLDASSVTFGLRSLERVLSQTSDTMEGMGITSSHASKILKEYGLDTGTTQERVMKLVDVIGGLNDESEKQALLFQLVGGRGIALLPVLEDLATRGYENVKEEMKDVGVLLDEQSIKAGTELYEANFKLGESWEGLKNKLAEGVVPALTKVVNLMNDYLDKAREIWKEHKQRQENQDLTLFGPTPGLNRATPASLQENFSLGAGALATTQQRASQAADELVKKIQELDQEHVKHKKTLEENRAAIEEYAAELGEKAPTQIKAYVNELKELDEQQVKSFSSELKKAYDEQHKLGEKNVKDNFELQKINEKYINDSFKATTEENKKELEQRTKDVLKYIKTTHELATEDVNSQFELDKIKLKSDEESVKTQEALHKIDFDKAIQMKKDLAKEELDIETKKIEAQIKIDELSPDSEVKVKQLKDKLLQLQKEYNLKIQELDDQSLTNRQHKFDNFINQIRSGMDTAINGWLQGTQTFSQAWIKMLDSLVVTFAKQLEKMLLDWIIFHDQKKAVSLATELKQITHTAASAAAHAYDAVVGIPIVGPVLAPPAAVVAFAAVEAFGALASAAGGMMVPNDMLAMVHKDERVLPAKYSQGLDALVNEGGGHTHFHYAPQVQAMDSEGVDRVLTKHRRLFVREMQTAKRNGQI